MRTSPSFPSARRVTVALAAVLTLGTACAPTRSSEEPQRGQIVSADQLSSLSTAETAAALSDGGFDTSTVRYGVQRYQLMYRTVDAQGQSVIASGLLVLPDSPAGHLWTVSFTHGTSSYRPQAPSKQPAKAFVAAPAISYAAAGFAAVAPDYVGLGAGTGVHPWMHVPTETSASLDMLRAARAFTQSAGRTLDDHILITGFSQGASAALGLARALQSGADPGFTPSAVAPVSGAYDFERAELPALVDGGVPGKIGVAYAAYLLVAWNRVHQLYEAPAELFQSPYAGRVETLFDGSTDGPEMLAALPDTVEQLLTAAGLDLVRHPGGRFLAALQEADSVCADWASRAPVRLYRADEDEQAVIANTDHCQNAFRASHVEVPVIMLGTPRYQGSLHLGSAVAATAATLRWFTDLNRHGLGAASS